MWLRNWILSYFILFFCFLWILKFDLSLIKNPRCGQWWLYSPLSSKPLVFCLDWHRAVVWRPWTTPPVFSRTSVLSWAVPGTSGHWPQAAQELLPYFLSLGGSVTACCLKSPGYGFFSSSPFPCGFVSLCWFTGVWRGRCSGDHWSHQLSPSSVRGEGCAVWVSLSQALAALYWSPGSPFSSGVSFSL